MKNFKPTDIVKYRVDVAEWISCQGYSHSQCIAHSESEFQYAIPEMENIVGSEEELEEFFANNNDYEVTFTIYEINEDGDTVDVCKASCWASEWYDGTSEWVWESVED